MACTISVYEHTRDIKIYYPRILCKQIVILGEVMHWEAGSDSWCEGVLHSSIWNNKTFN